MSFFRKLFGGTAAPTGAKPGPSREVEHRGFVIRAEPFAVEGGQFQTAGVISKEVEGVRKEHRFIRADRHASVDDALDFSIVKGRQIVDEQGERALS